jgi:hypothetical protein
MNAAPTGRTVGLIVLAVAAFILKRSYHGPCAVPVTSYLGNVSISFALYFLATIVARRVGQARLFAAACSLLVVETFELLDGFGIMSNVYDPWDLLANVVGVALGLGVDSLIRISAH